MKIRTKESSEQSSTLLLLKPYDLADIMEHEVSMIDRGILEESNR